MLLKMLTRLLICEDTSGFVDHAQFHLNMDHHRILRLLRKAPVPVMQESERDGGK